MDRRDLLRAAAATAALAVMPPEAQAQARAVWARLHNAASASPLHAPDTAPRAAALSEPHRALVRTVADAIIPRTDTPGANDVNVLAFIEIIVAEYDTEAERAAFTAGLDAMNAQALQLTGSPLANLVGEPLTTVMTALDAPVDRTTPAVRTYNRLKGLVVHGYFTSERVQKDVLHTVIMPGHFDGAAPMPAKGGGRDE